MVLGPPGLGNLLPETLQRGAFSIMIPEKGPLKPFYSSTLGCTQTRHVPLHSPSLSKLGLTSRGFSHCSLTNLHAATKTHTAWHTHTTKSIIASPAENLVLFFLQLLPLCLRSSVPRPAQKPWDHPRLVPSHDLLGFHAHNRQ